MGTTKGTPRSTRRELRHVFEAFDEVDQAEKRLREQLRRYRRLRDESRRHFENGGTASSLRRLMDIKSTRVRNDEALRDFYEARVDAQFALYRLAAAEGMSATEVGRTWGVSRQFVSRVLHTDRVRERREGRPVPRVGSRDRPAPA